MSHLKTMLDDMRRERDAALAPRFRTTHLALRSNSERRSRQRIDRSMCAYYETQFTLLGEHTAR
jgi:hypothetical protein